MTTATDQPTWKLTLRIYRKKGLEAPYFENFDVEVDPDEYVLDGVERIWALRDRSLAFRHACHHSTCGACGMRINGVEKLTCITPFRDVTHANGTVLIEPLRNFPVMADLMVDMGAFYQKMEQVGYPQVSQAPVNGDLNQEAVLPRLNDCIECGMCISACPIATTSSDYLGPAVLAGAQFNGIEGNPQVLRLVDHQDGLWRCHSVYECSEVCPSFVEPAWRIMDLRQKVMAMRIHALFHPLRS
jgi:succinate dehydrogenase / fumarate reductase iron-sulfur subunit